ncbi:MAG: hypothetical protein NTZ69_02470 [Bacteroidia bacterium]|nr:hypothetical protein [Bacteroidia bacterium]
MKKRLILCVIALLTLNLIVQSQTVQKSDSIVGKKKARHSTEEVTKFLFKNTRYPVEQLGTNAGEGDVVLSLVIHANGKSDILAIVSSPDKTFSTSSLVAFNKLEDKWSPARINNTPTDKNYLIIFRYRKYLDTQPFDYKDRIEHLMSKQKYKEALRQLSNAINDNKYDWELFALCSKVKQMLGDVEGAKSDELTAAKLDDEILSVVNVEAIGVTRTKVVRVVGSSTKRVVGW